MAAPSEKARVKTWTDRLRSGNKLYDKWSEKYRTEDLEEYYLGNHWRKMGLSEEEARKRYVINLVFSSIEVNKPALNFYKPQVRVQPRPGRSDDLGSAADERARLCQDTIQTFIDHPDLNFLLETNLALHEAHFRFGVIEVGYTSDYVDNPNAGRPVLKEGKNYAEDGTPQNDSDVVKDSNGDAVIHEAKTVTSEQLYFKRIPAHTYRVSLSNKNNIKQNDWVAYYEWMYVEDVKRNPAYSKNSANLKPTGIINNDLREPEMDAEDLQRRSGMVKVWRIWDLRRKVRHVVADGHDKFLQEGKAFSFLPHAIVKFYEILNSSYPLPPVFEWLGPQDEINETRDAQRAHRRRFYRRYTYTKGAIETGELEKLENGGDGVYAESNLPDPLQPVPDAPLSSDQWTHLDQSMKDFQIVSAVGGEQRGVAESETATQATIIDVRSRLRETSARTRVADWLAEIARLVLLTAKENMALPFWIQVNVDPIAAVEGSPETRRVSKVWKEISVEDLGAMDLEFDIFIDLASMSPVTEDVQRNSWNQVLALLSNPNLVMIMAQSEVILRKTLSLYGIRAENEIQEIKRVCTSIVQMLQAQQQAQTAADAKLPGTAGDLSAAAASQLTGPGAASNGPVAGPPGMADMLSQLSSVGKAM